MFMKFEPPSFMGLGFFIVIFLKIFWPVFGSLIILTPNKVVLKHFLNPSPSWVYGGFFTCFFIAILSDFVSYLIIYKKNALNPPPWGSKWSKSQKWVKIAFKKSKTPPWVQTWGSKCSKSQKWVKIDFKNLECERSHDYVVGLLYTFKICLASGLSSRLVATASLDKFKPFWYYDIFLKFWKRKKLIF